MTWARHASPAPDHGRFAQQRAITQAHTDIQNGRAARTVAFHADDAQDCANLLAMLGLDALEGKRSRDV
jgi:hypothetical protein